MYSQIWILPALLGAILWTIVNIFDNFSFKAILKRPSQGLIVSGIFSGFGLLLVPSWWHLLPPDLFFWAFFGGVLLQVSQFFYFSCLDNEELSDIVTYGSTYPIFVAIIATGLGKSLSILQWLGMCFVISGVLAIEWKRKMLEKGFNKNIVGYIVFLSASSIIVDQNLDFLSFEEIIFPYCLGLIFGGFLPLISKFEREKFLIIWPSINKNLWAFGLIEFINVVALLLEVLAMSIGHPALVNTVASSEPIFVVILASMVGRISFLKDFFPKQENRMLKFGAATLVILGLFMVTFFA